MIRSRKCLAVLLPLCLLACSVPAQERPTSANVPVAGRSRLGINLNGPADWNTEIPFVDVFRLSREWISQQEGKPWGQGPALERDENGWVKRLQPGCWAETVLMTVPAAGYPQGEYVCLYQGTGRIDFGGITREVERTPGRIVIEPNPAAGSLFLRLRETDPADPVRSIRVLLPGHEKTHRERPFNPVFIRRWEPLAVYRFMDWMLTNGSKVMEWADRPTPDYCNTTERGVPLETMVALCNQTGKAPWFCMPHRASDDYVRQFAAQVKRDLRAALPVYVEYSNELWNSGFEQTRYAERRGTELKLADRPWEAGWRYASRRSVEIFRIWEEVFGGRDRLVRVMATQAANPYIGEQKLAFEDAHKQCDALAIAPYISFNLSPSSKPSSDEVAAWTVDQVLDHVEKVSLPEATGWMRAHRALADRYRLRLLCYESGQHLVGVAGGENVEPLTRVLMAANRHERMGAFYERYLDAWREVGGGDLNVLFASTGAWSKWGSWGLIEHNADTTPKLGAVLRWNAANPEPSPSVP